jgi:hypothetical protein
LHRSRDDGFIRLIPFAAGKSLRDGSTVSPLQWNFPAPHRAFDQSRFRLRLLVI